MADSTNWSQWLLHLINKQLDVLLFRYSKTLLLSSIFTIIIFLCTLYKLMMITKKKNLPPGPPPWPLLGNLPSLSPNLHHHFANLSTQYGPIVSLKLGTKLTVVVSSPILAKSILRNQDLIFANRDVPVTAKIIAYGGQDVGFSPYGPTWRMLRKVMVHEMLSPISLDGLYQIRRTGIREMVSRVCDLAGTAGKSIDIGELVFRATFGTINNMLWGGLGGEGDALQLGVEFRDLVGEITRLLCEPNLSDFFPWLEWLDVQGKQKEMKRLLCKYDGIFDEMIEKGEKVLGNGGEVEGFLGFVLKKRDHEGGDDQKLTIIQMKAMFMDMINGGTDTSVGTIEWAMAELLHNPDIMKKAQMELDEVLGIDTQVEEFHLPKLVYLKAVIKEVLRLHPSLPLLVPRSPSSTTKVGDYIVPKDTKIFVNVWAIHRDPSCWPDPLEFKPERFLHGDKFDYSGNDFRYLPFGSGRRICAGIVMAERVVGMTLAALLHSFNWNIAEGETIDMSDKFGLVLKKVAPVVAIPRPRLSCLN